jgi:hypothetical protein
MSSAKDEIWPAALFVLLNNQAAGIQFQTTRMLVVRAFMLPRKT